MEKFRKREMGSPTFTLRLKERWFAAGSAVMRLIVKVVILATTPSLARRRGGYADSQRPQRGVTPAGQECNQSVPVSVAGYNWALKVALGESTPFMHKSMPTQAPCWSCEPTQAPIFLAGPLSPQWPQVFRRVHRAGQFKCPK